MNQLPQVLKTSFSLCPLQKCFAEALHFTNWIVAELNFKYFNFIFMQLLFFIMIHMVAYFTSLSGSKTSMIQKTVTYRAGQVEFIASAYCSREI